MSVHPGTKIYRHPFAPEDDATIIYFDSMHGPSKRALRIALNRGKVTTDSRPDALYGYRPTMSCSACWPLLQNLQKMRCQYMGMRWRINRCLKHLKVELLIPPPQYLQVGDLFLLPVVVGVRGRPLKLSASISFHDHMSDWAYTEISRQGEYFFLFKPLRFVQPGVWHICICVKGQGSHSFDLDVHCTV